MKNATDVLIKQRDAAQSLLEHEENKSFEFTVRLCDELIRTINSDAILSESQADFVAETVSNIGYKFVLDGSDVKYMEASGTCPFLVTQLATYINSCK